MDNILTKFNSPPEELVKNVDKEKARYDRYRILAQKAKQSEQKEKALMEERQIKLLGCIFKKCGCTWIDLAVAYGLVTEQLERAKQNPEYLEHWKKLGKEFQNGNGHKNTGETTDVSTSN